MRYIMLLSVLLTLASCTNKPGKPQTIGLQGKWLVETSGDVMLDPQTSGLKSWRGKLLTVSDGSGHVSQRLQLHVVDPKSAQVAEQSLPIILSEQVKQSCFGAYLSDAPDLEAIAVNPGNDSEVLVVTEDATRSGGYTPECAQMYKQTGSTDYPTLLLRLQLQDDNTLLLSHVRPLQFAAEFAIGNHPNDGIEGMAFASPTELYLGLEKDAQGHARIFSIKMDESFWESTDFIAVQDPQLRLPTFSRGNHPINGMDYFPIKGKKGALIAAARNDNTLWVIDLDKRFETKIIPLEFYAPGSDSCQQWILMNNASLEGVAVKGNTLFLVNDPWKVHYKENIVCEVNRDKYEKMAPLLFTMPIQSNWFN